MKKALSLLIISILIILSLLSCGGDAVCTEHKDSNNDEQCDICDATLEPADGDEGGGAPSDSLELVKDGDALFSILVASGASNVVSGYANDLIRYD